jgi:division protein CdvB (Snf7/Vps24/ESCRT-III family)
MNRNMNLPAIQRIAMEFERENDMMDQRQEMMDDVMDDAFEDEEEETDEIVDQVLDEIGIDLSQSVRPVHRNLVLLLARRDSAKRAQPTTRRHGTCTASCASSWSGR